MVKRLFAVGAGVTMLGATAMGAMAADLSNYPSMFVKDGTFNGFFVVGENAAAIDNLAMTDIAAAMKYNAPSATATTTVEGDNWRVGTSSQKYELTNSNSTQGSLGGENIYAIQTFIDKSELKALSSGSYATGEGTYAYQQYLYFDIRNSKLNEITYYGTNGDDKTADFFFVKSGANIGQYKLEFSSNAQSTIKDTAGSSSTSGTVLDDFENTKLSMMGKEYTLVLARRPQARPQGSIKLTMMGGAASGSLLEGDTTTLEASGKSYEIALTYVDSTYAKFTVNGEATGKLQKGDTYKLSDGNNVGVSEVLYQSYAGGVHSADFFIGANKLVLQDNTVTDSVSDSTLTIGSTSISGADVVITGTDDNSTFKISTIIMNMTADSDYYVGNGAKLSDVITAENDHKEMLFTNNWDVEYKGLEDAENHDIGIKSNSDRKYDLIWYDGDGNKVTMPLAYADSSTTTQLSEDGTKHVAWFENTSLMKNDYFILTGGTSNDGSGKSFLLQYKGADKDTATSPKIRFKNVGSGETLEYAVAGTVPQATIKLGGYSFAVNNVTDDAVNDFSIAVDLNGNGAIVNANATDTAGVAVPVDIIDYYGANITLTLSAAAGLNVTRGYSIPGTTSFNISTNTPNANDYDNQAPSVLKFGVGATTTNKVTAASFFVTGAGGGTSNPLITPAGETNIAYGYTSMGGKVTYSSPSSSPNELTYNYPKKQRLPQLYVTSGAVTSSTSAAGNLVAVEVIDATKLDSEIASASAQNLIVVGGPCVNTVAAALLGNPADCTQGFTPGKARVKLFENANGNMAMLVAGYSGADTRLAGKVVAHRAKEFSGTEVEVSGTTYTDATIGAPAVVAVESTPVAAEVPATQ